MSSFENLSYVTSQSALAPCRIGNEKYPFVMPWQVPDVTPTLKWQFNGNWVELRFKSYAQAVIDPESDLMVVVTSGDDFAEPGNGAVYNPDGTLNHQLLPTAVIQHSLGGAPPRSFPVERIEAIHIQDGKVRVDLNFSYEWIEERYYNPLTRIWSERVNVWRK